MGKWLSYSKDAGLSLDTEAFENRVIGIVATWVVGGALAIWLEVWTLVFRAADQLGKIPLTLQSDFEQLWFTLVRGVLFQVVSAVESLLVMLVQAAGPFGWVAAGLALAVMLYALAVAGRVIIRVIPFL